MHKDSIWQRQTFKCLAEVDETFMKVTFSTVLQLLLPLYTLHSLDLEHLLVSVVDIKIKDQKSLCVTMSHAFCQTLHKSTV